MTQWKIACSSADDAPMTAPILLRGDICENLKSAADLGYDAIEIHTRETAELDYESIRKTMAETGTKIAAVVTGRLFTEGQTSLTDDKPYVTDAAIKAFKQYIDIAAELKTDIIIGWAKGNVPAGAPRQRYLDRLAKNLRIIADYGINKNVKLHLEVINRYEVNIFTTCQETLEFIEKYNLENCFIHLDTFHMNIDETDPYEAIRLAGKKLGYVHLADNSRRYPGSGQLNFRKTLEALQEADYQGYLSVECFPYPNGKEAAAKAIQYLNSLEI